MIINSIKNIENNSTLSRNKDNINFFLIEDIFSINDFNNLNKEKYNIRGIGLGSNYNFFGLFSLLNKTVEKKILELVKKDIFNELLIYVPNFTPNTQYAFGDKWILMQKKLIKLKKWKKIIFSINNITQLLFIKENFGLSNNGIDFHINFNFLFYTIPTDPIFYLSSNQKDKTIWTDELLDFYINKILKYGFLFNKIEQQKPIQGIDYGDNKKVLKNIIFFGPKVIYSLTNRIFQLSKIKNIDISMLFDIENFNITDNNIELLYNQSLKKENHIYGKYDIFKLKRFIKENEKTIDLSKISDNFAYYQNNYQYYNNYNL